MFTAIGYVVLMILGVALAVLALVVLIAVGLRWLSLNPAPPRRGRE
jgi:hypothetical protein